MKKPNAPTLGALVASAIVPLSFAAGVLASDIETVTVTAERGIENSNSSASISKIDSDQLGLIAAVHINESLARVAGTWISRGNGQEHLTAIRSPVLTGAGSCGGFLVAEDGLATRPSGFCNVNQLFEVNAGQADSIEVLKGPGSVFYGSNALHGIINVISAAPKSGTQMGINIGPDDYQQLDLGWGQDFENSALGAKFSGSKDGGYKEQSGFAQQKLSLAYDHKGENFSVQNRLHLSNLNQETAGFVLGFENYKDQSVKKTNPNPEAFRDAKSLRLSSRIQWRLDDSSELQITPYLRHSEMRFIQHYLPGQALEQNEQTSWGVQTSWRETLSETWWLDFGVDVEFADGELLENQPWPTDSSSAFLRATIPQGKHYDYQVDSRLFAGFIRSQWQLSDSLQLDAGLRYEFMEYDYDNQMADGGLREDGSDCLLFGSVKTCRHWRPADAEDSFDNVSYQLGFTQALNQQLSLYGRVAKSFRAPQATELYRLQKGQQQAELDSVSLASIELGLRAVYENLTFNVSAYSMTKDNVIFRDSDGFNIDNSETEHRGVELEFGYSFNPQWSLNGSASVARHQYRNNPDAGLGDIDGNDVDTAPRQQWNIRLAWQPVSELKAELEWLHLGRYYLEPQNEHQYQGHDLLNLRSQYTLASGLQLSARITNLLDKDYAERADYAFGGYRYFVGQDRGVYLGANFSF